MIYSTTIEELLVNAFAGESMARNRYNFFAKIADKEGFKTIRDIFIETANNEHQHAKLFYNHISAGTHYVNAPYPYFTGTTKENLKFAADGEKEEWEIIYRHSADIAKNEGYNEISDLFNAIIEVEKHHEYRYRSLYEQLDNETLFCKENQTQWICTNCGYITIGKSAPKACPCCKHPQGFFKIFCEKF